MHRRHVVYAAQNLPEAQDVCQELEAAGIRAVVVNDSASDITFGLPKPVQVLVEEDAVEAARLVLRKFALESDATESAAPTQVEPWPNCPECGQVRAAQCRYCGTIAVSAPADDSEAEPATPLLHICPTCDEPQEPLYVAQCQNCGHRFDAGAEPETPEPITWRIGLATLGIVAVVAVILVYLVILFSR